MPYTTPTRPNSTRSTGISNPILNGGIFSFLGESLNQSTSSGGRHTRNGGGGGGGGGGSSNLSVVSGE